ncbi:MAG TPA: ATP-binding protein, partial [Phormidium sp.]
TEEFSYAKQVADEGIFERIQENTILLSRKECADILDYQLAVTIYTAMEEEDITEVFGRINSSGKHLSRQERRQAGVTTPFAEAVRTIAMRLRGDDSDKVLRLSNMPEISIDSRQSTQGYRIKAEDTIWCRQGALTISQLRESEDEQMIADIAASILLNKPLPVSTERLDSLYDPTSRYFQDLESSLATYGSKKLADDIIKAFSIVQETIEAYSIEPKCLRRVVNPNSNNPIRTAFYTIFMACFDLVIRQETSPVDPTSIMNALRGLQQKLDLSGHYTTTEDRERNINQTKGLIQNYFATREPPVLGHGAELAFDFVNSLRRSRIETSRYECKQGLLDLASERKFNQNLLERIIETICGIANLGSDADGYIHIGVTDSKKDADRIEEIDKIKPIEVNGRYVVGIDREAELQNKTIEQYVKVLINAIQNSALTEPLKTQVLTKFDTISYKGYSVIRITIPAQTAMSFVGKTAFTRKDSSTISIEGPELLAIFQLFQK